MVKILRRGTKIEIIKGPFKGKTATIVDKFESVLHGESKVRPFYTVKHLDGKTHAFDVRDLNIFFKQK